MPQELNSYEQLASYYDAARQEAEARQETVPISRLEAIGDAIGASRPSLAEAIETAPDIAVIAEYKRRSPSEGGVWRDSTVAWTVEQYRHGGASALSIVTQNQDFGGKISDISEAFSSCQLPILRKDFISTEYQLHEARARGAAAVLLIVAGLENEQLNKLYYEAGTIDLECLVEVHSEDELERALELEPEIIGVNNRNLSNPKDVDTRIAHELIPMVPDDIITVAESGWDVHDQEHIRELRKLSDAVLMGTALMREFDPASALANWLATDQAQQ
jgi:indole-3-glycerol phosphate synthase